MSEITMDTFLEAARETGERIRGGGKEKKLEESKKEALRKRIEALFAAEPAIDVDLATRQVSDAVALKIADMLWPEKSLEIKKKQAEMEVERGALIGYIKEILQEGI